jgi:PKD repeat protein/dienelactone hydrolase
VALALALCIVAVLAASHDAAAVERPIGRGPYSTGWIYQDVMTSTKTYPTPIKVFYPATQEGEVAPANWTEAPYPAVIWLPFMGGNREVQGLEVLQPLCSWGFVVMAVSVNWDDFGNSANAADINDLLDWLEEQSANATSPLFNLVETGSYGISGHSSGGGMSVLNGALVPRIKAVQPFAPAIGTATVDALASMYDKPILVQVGKQDDTYIAGSRRIYEKFTCQRSLVEIMAAGHGGPFKVYLLSAFYLYWLSGKQEYRTFLYELGAMEDVAQGTYELKFNLSGTDFFPPIVSARASKTSVDMDEPVDFNGTVVGYHLLGQGTAVYAWDFDGDGMDEASDPIRMDASWAYRMPGAYDVTFAYKMGALYVPIPLLIHISARNVAPVAVLGPDVTVDQDAEVSLDASDSWDTASDQGRLQYLWDFDDFPAVTTDAPYTTHTFTEVGEHAIVLTVRDPFGASSSALMNVTVLNVLPRVDAGADARVEEDSTLQLKGVADDTATDLPRLRYRWDFGDGFGTDWASGNSTSHTFTASGDHSVTLFARDGGGAVASDDLTVRVVNLAPMVALITPGDGSRFVEERVIDFRGSASDTPSDIDGLLVMWDFGDGNGTGWVSVSRLDATHTYLLAGDCTVTLTARDGDGATAEASVTLEIMDPAPKATIVRPSGLITVPEDTLVAFEGTGTDTPSQTDFLSYTWEIDGDWSVGQVVERTFTRAGTYVVVLRVTDPEGEAAEANVTVRVRNVPPEAVASVTPLTLRVGGLVNFSGSASDTPSDAGRLVVRWDLGDGNRTANLTGSHVFTRAGHYTVTFTVTDDDGEVATRDFLVRVEAMPSPPPPIGPEDDGEVGSLSTTAIAGIVLAALVVVVVVLALLMRRRAPPAGGSD